MVAIILYVIGGLVLFYCMIIVIKDFRVYFDFTTSGIEKAKPVLELVVVALGVLAAVATLNASVDALDLERTRRTNALMYDEFDTNRLLDVGSEVRELLLLAYSKWRSTSYTDEERAKRVDILLNQSPHKEDREWFLGSLHKLMNCADTQECDSDRVYNIVCNIFDDVGRTLGENLNVDFPANKEASLRVLWSLHLEVSNQFYNKSCPLNIRVLDYAIEGLNL